MSRATLPSPCCNPTTTSSAEEGATGSTTLPTSKLAPPPWMGTTGRTHRLWPPSFLSTARPSSETQEWGIYRRWVRTPLPGPGPSLPVGDWGSAPPHPSSSQSCGLSFTMPTLNLFPLLGTTSLPSLLLQWKWTDLVIEVPKSYPNTRNQGSLGLGRMEGTPTEWLDKSRQMLKPWEQAGSFGRT